MQLRDPDPVFSRAAPGPEDARSPPPATQPGGAPGNAPACAIVALSDDPVLLEALAGAAVGGASVMSSPSTDRFIDQMVANGAGIALIDGSTVTIPLRNFLVTVREQFPQLLILLTGPAQLQAQFEAQIRDGTVFRFVHKPASSARLKLFIDAAMRQQALSPSASPAAPARSPARTGVATRVNTGARRGPVAIGVWVVAALAAATIAWIYWHRSAPPELPAPEAVADQGALPRPAESPAAAPAPDAAAESHDVQQLRDLAAREAGLPRDRLFAGGSRIGEKNLGAQGRTQPHARQMGAGESLHPGTEREENDHTALAD